MVRRWWLALAAVALSLPEAGRCDRFLRSSRGTTLAEGSKPGVGSAVGPATSQTPKVHFLFLAVDKISNLGIWRNFFMQAPEKHYRAFIHCKLKSCLSMVAGTPLVPVPTVPSYYCTDLVSPMNQLLAHALTSDASGSNPLDKFAFISDSTLPAKPFSQVYATLTSRPGSDLCVFPSKEWASIPSVGSAEVAVKHHQWVVLDRPHSVKAVALWNEGRAHDFMRRFQMNLHTGMPKTNFTDGINFGCLDEFWHIMAVYGTLRHVNADRDVDISLPLFHGGPLKVSAQTAWQGSCPTFVVWSQYLHIPGKNPFGKLHTALDPMSIPHSGNHQRPGWWDKMSAAGMSAIRNSEFLFVRKFIDNPTLTSGGDFGDTYTRVVLM